MNIKKNTRRFLKGNWSLIENINMILKFKLLQITSAAWPDESAVTYGSPTVAGFVQGTPPCPTGASCFGMAGGAEDPGWRRLCVHREELAERRRLDGESVHGEQRGICGHQGPCVREEHRIIDGLHTYKCENWQKINNFLVYN